MSRKTKKQMLQEVEIQTKWIEFSKPTVLLFDIFKNIPNNIKNTISKYNLDIYEADLTLSKKYKISQFPSLIYIRDNKEIFRLSGEIRDFDFDFLIEGEIL